MRSSDTAAHLSSRTRLICAGLCLLCLAATNVGHAAPLDNIAKETISGMRTSGNFKWNYGYDIEFKDSMLNITMDIEFQRKDGVTADQLKALKPTWESGIEDMWNNKFTVVKDGKWKYPIKFNVNFADPHHTVMVRPGPARSSSHMWDTQDAARPVAHEFGHLLGHFDEYEGGALDPNSTKDNTSIMGSTAEGVTPKSRHYTQYADWLKAKKPTQTFTIEPHVQGVTTVGPLSNFDVTNNSAQAANDFELKLKGIKKDDVMSTFPGYGNPPTMTDMADGVQIRWAGADIPVGSARHFRVTLKRGKNAEGATSTWTKDGNVIAANSGIGVQQYWAADASSPNSIGSTIRNTAEVPLLVSTRFSQVLDSPVPLDLLTRDLVVPWSGDFSNPVQLNPGDFLYTPFDLGGLGRAVVGQIQVFDPSSPSLPLVFYTNEGVGSQFDPTHGLVTGDFNLNNDWFSDDLPVMQTALLDPDAYRMQHGLTMDDLLLLGDLNGDSMFNQTDYQLAVNWVPLDNTLNEIPEPTSIWLLAVALLAVAPRTWTRTS